MGTLLIKVKISLYKLSYLNQSQCKILTLINRAPMYIFGVLKHHGLMPNTQFLFLFRVRWLLA